MGEFDAFNEPAKDDFSAFDKPIEAPKPDDPGFLERVGAGLSRIKKTVGTAAETAYRGTPLEALIEAPAGEKLSAAGKALKQRWTSDLTDPSRRREFLRGLDSLITLGYGQQFADWAGRKLGDEPGAQLAATAQTDRAAAPGVRELGLVTGMASPGAANALARAGGGLVKAGTAGIKAGSLPAAAALGAARSVAGYEATAPLTAALHADSAGKRAEAAREAATDPTGLVLSGVAGAGGGAAGRIASTAKDRVAANIVRNIGRGEEGGKANPRLANKVVARAESGSLEETFGRHKDLEKALATEAASNPGKAGGKVQGVLDKLKGEIDPVYKAIDAGPAVPQAADLTGRLKTLSTELEAAGNAGMAKAVETFSANIAERYKGKPLPASALRNLRGEVAELAGFSQTADPKFRQAAQQRIYGAINDTIEDAGRRTPGVDVDRLKTLNKDTSNLIAVKDALVDRAAKGATGGTSSGNLALAHALTTGVATGIATGNLKAALGAAALGYGAGKLRNVGRGLDYRLAQRASLGVPELSVPAGARLAAALQAARATDERGGSAAPVLSSKFLVAGDSRGMLEPGNVDLTNRPDVVNPDGSHSSVRSMSFEENGREILVPTVSEDGRIMTDDEAIAQYHRTGRHLGKFKTPAEATAYADLLHRQQEAAGARR